MQFFSYVYYRKWDYPLILKADLQAIRMEFYRKYFATFWLGWQVFLMAINLYTYLDKRLTMFYRGNKSANLFYGPIFCLLSFMRAWRNQIAHRYSWSLISSTARIITWFSSTSLWRWWTRAQIWKFENLKTILILQGFVCHILCVKLF